ncbi:DUF3883 domain-containing protein [Rhizobium leguminosarum]|uniref:DUF3883 domain-containing protein n=1 Tax=Rhizobium leguminosarum TaxID=384 RepID=UPI001C9671C4|nr:DUF3883 domain-containing protein [Rhizobium leguminosarum]MBY5505328.1 DUF3883 domain-containing protein [Rhizobium leguminosarum]
MTDIIVFHTAWMAKYDGDRASLSAGGFKFAAENGYGHEMLNFRDIDGTFYGYVPPTGNLHLEKHFDVPRQAEKLEGATVVWTAPHPEQGGRAVVGVWRNATVYREVQYPKGKLARRRMIGGEAASYLCTAKADDCVLLEPDARPIFVRPGQPRNGQSWPGQQKVFYPKPGSPALKLLNRILKNVNPQQTSKSERSASKSKAGRSGWQADVERRRKIEEAAVLAVGSKLERLGFSIESVEKENLGYDLVATRNEEILHIEVKGRSGSDVSAELTVNEFDCLKNYQRQRNPNAHYRIAIVTDALNKPIINEFVMVRGQKSQWYTLDGRWRLNFEERMAARLTSVSNLEVPNEQG